MAETATHNGNYGGYSSGIPLVELGNVLDLINQRVEK